MKTSDRAHCPNSRHFRRVPATVESAPARFRERRRDGGIERGRTPLPPETTDSHPHFEPFECCERVPVSPNSQVVNMHGNVALAMQCFDELPDEDGDSEILAAVDAMDVFDEDVAMRMSYETEVTGGQGVEIANQLEEPDCCAPAELAEISVANRLSSKSSAVKYDARVVCLALRGIPHPQTAKFFRKHPSDWLTTLDGCLFRILNSRYSNRRMKMHARSKRERRC